MTLILTSGNYQLTVNPALGGSIAGFTFCGQPLMRSGTGPGILDTACFPLVPFSNRIAHGRFSAHGQQYQLTPNLPTDPDHPHAIHGFGWQAAWDITSAAETGQNENSTTLTHHYPAGEWIWPYTAKQIFTLSETGLRHSLSIRNHSHTAMPTGLGLHPYFPINDQTIYHATHGGEWHTAHDGLPISHAQAEKPLDHWQGNPADSRCVDTIYTARSGDLAIHWPDRALSLTITPCEGLPFTAVYTPKNADFFCVEPVSHATNAINRAPDELRWLEPDQDMTVWVDYRAAQII
ncbi:MAG: hypothetical protein RLY97_595 [Pseudomonadota bacterium]